ncbi:MAG TPA: aminotransferase class I/II-fold pyridoxal phosphate-dependent enzyme, partial [Verrucomicrobiota bacterium]|nr:aminotransferase class I/II-fold pyridoxal phosphate-dependent enzyme [Verrucomicrobiota bacterium]
MEGHELARLQKVLESGWVTTAGEELAALEKEFERMTGCTAVALVNGTSALHLAVKLAGVGDGAEVVVPTLTFAAAANAVVYEHGRPVFLDSSPIDWGLDANLLEEFLDRRARENRLPKAVIVVHLFGQCADLDPILEVCRKHEVPLIEDAAECLGATYKGKFAGALGDIGVYSFNGNKVITGGGGGMLVSPRVDWVAKARFWSTQARDADPEGLRNYVHSEVGYNYRMSNVLAAIVLAQLEVLDKRVQQRRAVAFRYKEAFADLPGITLMPQVPDRLHTNWLS